MADWTVQARAGLTDAQRDEVLALRRLCQAHDGSDLKLELSHVSGDAPPDTLLVHEGGTLAGYAGVDPGVFVEVCGMVHPEHRGRGIGTALLDHALPIVREAGRTETLVICEDAVPSAQRWLERRGAVLHFAEHRMVATLREPVPDGPVLELRPVRTDDIPALVDLIVRGFDDARPVVEERLRDERDPDRDNTWVADVDGAVAATMRISADARRPMIYGFVVDERCRNRGIGAAMLRTAMQRLRARGTPEVGLEVETTNDVAIRLYRRFGFEQVTTYRYMRLAV